MPPPLPSHPPRPAGQPIRRTWYRSLGAAVRSAVERGDVVRGSGGGLRSSHHGAGRLDLLGEHVPLAGHEFRGLLARNPQDRPAIGAYPLTAASPVAYGDEAASSTHRRGVRDTPGTPTPVRARRRGHVPRHDGACPRTQADTSPIAGRGAARALGGWPSHAVERRRSRAWVRTHLGDETAVPEVFPCR